MMEEELKRCTDLYETMTHELETLPKGSLTCRDGKLLRFLRENKKQYLVQVDDKDPIVNELRKRRFIKEALPDLKKHIKACEEYLQKDQLYDSDKIDRGLPPHYRGQQMLLKGDLVANDWRSMPYIKNPAPFMEEHYTLGGIKCRSKSEALIGIALEQRNIDFQYDAQLNMNGIIKYPDFKILLPQRRSVVYLEHFGMIDKPDYAEANFRKMEIYRKNGLYLGVNFFYTCETKQVPLNMKMINEILDEIMALDQL